MSFLFGNAFDEADKARAEGTIIHERESGHTPVNPAEASRPGPDIEGLITLGRQSLELMRRIPGRNHMSSRAIGHTATLCDVCIVQSNIETMVAELESFRPQDPAEPSAE